MLILIVDWQYSELKKEKVKYVVFVNFSTKSYESHSKIISE
jgi:hypothetical protein